MQTLGITEIEQIRTTILDKYEKVAKSPTGQFRYPTGMKGLTAQGYDPALVALLPLTVREFFVGVGNPLSLHRIEPGQKVLDVGCGAGVDTLFASLLVGEQGKAVGVEFSPAMAARAQVNKKQSAINNAVFLNGSAEKLPLRSESFDVVISSGVFNLVVDKERALHEVFRVLKKGGRFQVADQILNMPFGADRRDMVSSWFT